MCRGTRVYLPLFISVINIASSEYVPVNWNLTNEKGNAHLERRYKYPMYNEVAPAVCDLTYNYCDASCCSDPECREWQRETFNCDGITSHKPKPFNNYDCDYDSIDKPSWFSFFCYVYENSAYLGRYFVTMPKIHDIKKLKSVVSLKKNVYKFADEYTVTERKNKQLPYYKYESSVMSYVLSNDSVNLSLITPFSIKMATLKESPSACTSSPIKFRKNAVSNCYTSVTPEQCDNGYHLSISPYLCRDGSKSELENFPFILKNLNSMESVETDVVIKCASTEFKKKTFNRKKYYYYNAAKQLKDCTSHLDIFTTKLNGLTCHNVLVNASYHFTVNGSNIIKLQAEFLLTDVVLRNLSGKNEASKDLLYISQGFSVIFKDVEPDGVKNVSEIDSMNRGYLFGEELNFGNISGAEKTEQKAEQKKWEKGFIGIFKNGGNCNESVPATFGYDMSSTCIFRQSESNCTRLREMIGDKFEESISGGYLAPVARFKSPYNNPVPILRNYNEHQWNETANNNSFICPIAIRQFITVQYTSITGRSNRPVHRAIGLRIDRQFRNVSLLNQAYPLTSRISFVFISSSQEKPLSRLSRPTFEAVLSLINGVLTKKNDKPGRTPVAPEKQLLLTLWILGTPDSYRSVGDRFDVGKATAIAIVRRVVLALYEKKKLFIVWPNNEETIRIVKHFQKASAFPNTLGAIDGTHIKITSPSENAESYINRKSFHSIQLQAVCDHETKFIHAFAGYPGSVHDQRVFNMSEVSIYLNDNVKFSHGTHLVGDAAYQIHRSMMVPYKDNGALTIRERNFNFCQSSARMVIERAFGLLKGRFRRLLHHLDMKTTELIPHFIMVSCILHNICVNFNDKLDPNEIALEDEDEEDEELEIQALPRVNINDNLEKELGREKRIEITRMLPIRDN